MKSFCMAILALAAGAWAPAAGAAVGDLYVTSDMLNATGQYNGTTGAYLSLFASSVSSGELGIHFGTTNGRVLIGHFAGGVDEFDAGTGAYIKTYNPGAGTQWAGLYAPNGNVYIGSWDTNDVREYDATTGAFVSILCTANAPADMRIGPNGNLYICEYTSYTVKEVDAVSGALVSSWGLPFGARTNDIAFLPNGDILVTAMGFNMCYRFDAAHTPLGSFSGTGWFRTHGIDISPWNGTICIVDGETTQVHVFDPVTYAELSPAFLTPGPGGKIVDLEFRPEDDPTATQPSTWGALKGLYR